MINKWKYFKTAKVNFEFMVTIVTAYIGELCNAHQTIPHKILGNVVKFWLYSPNCLNVILKNHFLGGEAESAPPPSPPRLDRVHTSVLRNSSVIKSSYNQSALVE